MLQHFKRKGMAPGVRPVMVSPKKGDRGIFTWSVVGVITAGTIITGMVIGLPARDYPEKYRLRLRVVLHPGKAVIPQKKPLAEKKVFEARKPREDRQKVGLKPPKKHNPQHKRFEKARPLHNFGLRPASTTKGASHVTARPGNTLMKAQGKKYTSLPKQAEAKNIASDMVYRAGQVDKPPTFVFRAVPRYPPEAEEDEVEGTVLVWVVVDKKGRPVKVERIRGESSLLVQAAKQAVIKSRFSPAIYHTRPVKCMVEIPYKFRLE